MKISLIIVFNVIRIRNLSAILESKFILRVHVKHNFRNCVNFWVINSDYGSADKFYLNSSWVVYVVKSVWKSLLLKEFDWRIQIKVHLSIKTLYGIKECLVHVYSLQFKRILWVKMFASSNLFKASFLDQLIHIGSEEERSTCMSEVKALVVLKIYFVCDVFMRNWSGRKKSVVYFFKWVNISFKV